MPSSQELHYLFDMRNALAPGLAPIDAQFPINNSNATSGFVFRIQNGFDYNHIMPSSDVVALSTEKEAAILDRYVSGSGSSFSNSVFDHMGDASNFDASTASGCSLGERGCFYLYTSLTTVTTNTIVLTGAPSEAILHVETFTYSFNDSKNQVGMRIYQPDSIAAMTSKCKFDVSFNNGATWISSVTSGSLITIPVPDQGTNFKFRFSLTGFASRTYLGSWAILY